MRKVSPLGLLPLAAFGLLLLPCLLLALPVVDFIELPEPVGRMFYRPADSSVCGKLQRSDSVVVIDCRTQMLREVVLLEAKSWGCYNPVTDRMYASDSDGLAVTDCSTWTVVARPRFEGGWLCRPWCSPAHGRLYAPFAKGGSTALLAVYDTRADSFTGTLSLDSCNRFFSCRFTEHPTEPRVYCSQYPHGCVTVVDAEADTVITRVRDVIMPSLLTCDPQRSKVYCENGGDGSITVFEATSGRTLALIDPGRWTSPLACAFREGKVYAVFDGIPTPVYTPPSPERGLVVIDSDKDSIIAVVDTGLTPTAMVYDADAGWLYCSARESDGRADSTVTVVDCRSSRIVASYVVGRSPGPAVIDPVSGNAFVPLWDSPRVAVIPRPQR